MWSILPSLIALGPVAIIAAWLSNKRLSPQHATLERRKAAAMLGIATMLQAVHFLEEWITGFHVKVPALFGFAPMPLWIFVAFNLSFILIWLVSVPYLRKGRKPAFFAAWFLAIAGVMNGFVHPILAMVSGGYFPGLVTSPFIGVMAFLLWRRLNQATKVISPTG